VFPDGNLLSLLALSREYQVESVRSRCLQYIVTETDARAVRKLTPDRLMLFLHACDEYGLKQPLKTLQELAFAVQASEFKICQNYNLRTSPSFVHIVTQRCQALENILAQVKFTSENYGKYFPSKWTHPDDGVSRYNKCNGCEKCAHMKMKDKLQAITEELKNRFSF
jgi:hypothetical protein